MTPQEHLAKLMQYGATVEVRKTEGGPYLAPWPVDYLNLTDTEVSFWWLGKEERLHTHDVTGWRWGEDGAVLVDTREGFTIVIEPVWNDDQREKLAIWAGWKVPRDYPGGGWRYAQV